MFCLEDLGGYVSGKRSRAAGGVIVLVEQRRFPQQGSRHWPFSTSLVAPMLLTVLDGLFFSMACGFSYDFRLGVMLARSRLAGLVLADGVERIGNDDKYALWLGFCPPCHDYPIL